MSQKDMDRPRELKRSRKPAHPMKREIKSEIKSHAESTMNELLNWYKYGKADRRDPDVRDSGFNISTLKENCVPKKQKVDESLSSLPGVMRKGGTESSSASEQTKIQICTPQIPSAPLIKIPAEQGVSSEQVTCAWCQKAGTRRYSLHMGSELKSFCSEKCFAACRRANFKRNKARDKNGQDENSAQHSKWKESPRQGVSEPLVCDWCRHVRQTTEYLDFGASDRRLNFCSPKCLNQYKMGIFYKETHTKQANGETRQESCKMGQRLLKPEPWNIPQGDLHSQVDTTVSGPTETTPASSLESRVACVSPAFCIPVIHTSGPEQQRAAPSATCVPANTPKEMLHHHPSPSCTEHQKNSLQKPNYSTAPHGLVTNLHPAAAVRGPPPPDSSVLKPMHFHHSQPLPTIPAVPGTPAWPMPPYLATHTPVPPFIPNSMMSNHHIAMAQRNFTFSPLTPSPTLLVPYPVIVPLPVPVPIPIPLRAQDSTVGNRDIVSDLPRMEEDKSEDHGTPPSEDAGENKEGSKQKQAKARTSEKRSFTQVMLTPVLEQGRADTVEGAKAGSADPSLFKPLSSEEVMDLTFRERLEVPDLPLPGTTRTSSSPMSTAVALACDTPSRSGSRSQPNLDSTQLRKGNMGAEPSPATPCTNSVTVPVFIQGVALSEDAAVGEPEALKKTEWLAEGTSARGKVSPGEGGDGGDKEEPSSTDEEHPYTPAPPPGEKLGKRSIVRVTCVTAAEDLGDMDRELPPKRRCLRIRHLNK
ncbi:hypothetical protein GN956_G16284 [Arapaima gigas]